RIDGIDVMVAQTLLSEVGLDMSRWITESHFASWLGLCPDNRISGDKVLSRGTRRVVNRAAQSEVHAFVTAVLLGMARLDAFDADAQAEPPDRQLAQVEQGVCGSEGHAIIAADVGGQAAFFKKPLKHSESVIFPCRRKRLTGEEKAASVVGDGERITVLAIAQQELAFVIGAPELV